MTETAEGKVMDCRKHKKTDKLPMVRDASSNKRKIRRCDHRTKNRLYLMNMSWRRCIYSYWSYLDEHGEYQEKSSWATRKIVACREMFQQRASIKSDSTPPTGAIKQGVLTIEKGYLHIAPTYKE